MLDPKISIITATFNSEKTIRDTLESVKSQKYKNFEHIIIDGKSTDSTIKIVSEYESNIDVIISEKDKGIYDAFNKGIEESTGDIVYFLNSDDTFYDDLVLADVAKEFTKNQNIEMLYGNVVQFDLTRNFSFVEGKTITIEDLQKGIMTPHQGLFAKKTLFEKYGMFDLTYRIAGDFDFVIKCFKYESKDHIKYLDRNIAFFRLGGISTDSSQLTKLRGEQKSIIHKHFGSANMYDSFNKDDHFQFRKWLESLLISKQGITHKVKEKGIKNVVILGTKLMGILLLEDLLFEDFEVVSFIDNNPNMQGHIISNIEVKGMEWLHKNADRVDCIIVSIENTGDVELINELKYSFPGILVLSWKDLLI
ncbi:glycosyltransferase family 2 protein [Bacillus salitolerans]|uniref:Glycosyltransferase family 2 protein n=1 Tax=Bacillus salitolerans TaxID=1437434 RepID=A0ABW4LNS4_9BACI